MKGRTMLCQFSTALLDRTASFQAAKSSATIGCQAGGKSATNGLVFGPKMARRSHAQPIKCTAASPNCSGQAVGPDQAAGKRRRDGEGPPAHDGPASQSLFLCCLVLIRTIQKIRSKVYQAPLAFLH